MTVPAPFLREKEPVSGRLGSTDRCRSCGARIAWAVTTKGRRIPLDLSVAEDGNVAVERNDLGDYLASVLGSGDTPDGDRYVSHFATCEFASGHRGRRRR